MVTVRQIVTVTRDDPLFSEYERLYDNAGWRKKECTVSTTWSSQTIVWTPNGEEEDYEADRNNGRC